VICRRAGGAGGGGRDRKSLSGRVCVSSRDPVRTIVGCSDVDAGGVEVEPRSGSEVQVVIGGGGGGG
jgi:hypothetical protein